MIMIRHWFFLLGMVISSAAFGQDSVAVPKPERGIASYYSHRFHGRKMASGDRYHRDSMYCAHKTLPFGTKLRVRNLSNDKEVMVVVADRGPFSRGRIVDLSYSAAHQIGIIQQGLARVEITVIKEKEPDIQVPFLARDSVLQMDYDLDQPLWLNDIPVE